MVTQKRMPKSRRDKTVVQSIKRKTFDKGTGAATLLPEHAMVQSSAQARTGGHPYIIAFEVCTPLC